MEEGKTAWRLAHVVVHTTASGEESLAQALTLARGVKVEGRSRYEIPVEQIKTAGHMRQRLEESRRMRLAMLDAWPDEPHYENTYSPFPRAGQINAKGSIILGLSHDQIHLGQLTEIMRQARIARSQNAAV